MENVAPCCTWKHHFLSQRSLVKHGVSRSSITLSNRTHAKIATQTTPPDSLPSIHLQFLDPCRSVLPWILSLWLQTTQQTYRMWRGTQESGRREGGREGEGCWKKINLQQRSSRDKTEDGEDVRRTRLSNLRSKTPERSGLNLPERRMRGDFSKYGSF